MIDHVFGKPVADILSDIRVVDTKTTLEHGFRPHAEDEEIIRNIADDGYIFLTHDRNTIDEYRFPPCSHGGIIIIRDKRWTEEKVLERIRDFCQCGYKKLAPHSVTYLHAEGAIIHTHDGKKEVRY
jgi:hypothetical protein